jgi:hypothetical protein
MTRAPHPGEDRLLTAAETAALFRVRTDQVGRWRRRGMVPRYAVQQGAGGQWLYLEPAMRALAEAERES